MRMRLTQFSMKFIFGLIIVVAMLTRFYTMRIENAQQVAQRQQKALSQLLASNWTVWLRDTNGTSRGFVKGTRLEFVKCVNSPGTHCDLLIRDGSSSGDAHWEMLDSLPDVVSVQVSGSSVDDGAILHISQLPKLRDLRVANASITDAGLEFVADCRNLDALSLATTDIGDRIASIAAGIPRLRSLALHQTGITDSCVEGLKNVTTLRVLVLSDTSLTDRSVASLSTMQWLEVLDIRRTQISIAEAKTLTQLLPNTRVLYR